MGDHEIGIREIGIVGLDGGLFQAWCEQSNLGKDAVGRSLGVQEHPAAALRRIHRFGNQPLERIGAP
jgi:hypothetical protein